MNGLSAGKNKIHDIAGQRLRLRRLTIDALLTSLALVLSIVERWIPLDLLVPVPGLKLGLANIVTLFALLRLRPLDALVILLVRCLVMGAITGPTTLLFSLAGGLLAMLAMWLLSRWEGRSVSVIGISLLGAAAHNIGQVAMAGLVLNEPLLFLTYLPPLLLTSLATGTLTGVAAFPVVRRFKPLLSTRRVSSPPALSLLAVILCLGLVAPALAGCQPAAVTTTTATSSANGYQKYTYEFTGTFDTVIQFIGYAKSEADFKLLTTAGEKRFRELNQLFDPYHDYPGINNLKTINDKAGQEPVKVSPELLQLISLGIKWNQTISDKTNIAIGPAVTLWQTYRDQALNDPATAAVPSPDELAQALAHSDISSIQIDQAAGTVYLADAAMRLDVGAVGKGYATEIIAQEMIKAGALSMIINAGGSNVRLIGKPLDNRTTWNIGLQNPAALLPDQPEPDGSTATPDPTGVPDIAANLRTNGTSIVTSGDYQRFYQVGDTVYHHLIDPADGMPTHYYRAVTVVTEDSGLADFMSTALFLLPYAESRAMAEKLGNIEVLWIFPGNHLEMTSGMASLIDVPK